jgi:hypothetical protein
MESKSNFYYIQESHDGDFWWNVYGTYSLHHDAEEAFKFVLKNKTDKSQYRIIQEFKTVKIVVLKTENKVVQPTETLI